MGAMPSSEVFFSDKDSEKTVTARKYTSIQTTYVHVSVLMVPDGESDDALLAHQYGKKEKDFSFENMDPSEDETAGTHSEASMAPPSIIVSPEKDMIPVNAPIYEYTIWCAPCKSTARFISVCKVRF